MCSIKGKVLSIMEREEKKKIESFTDLYAWQEEQFGLTNQLRRAVVSVTSNISEGFSRKSSKEKSQFYSVALGSLTELQNQILIARDVEYIKKEDFDKIASQTVIVSKIINGLIKSVLTR